MHGYPIIGLGLCVGLSLGCSSNAATTTSGSTIAAEESSPATQPVVDSADLEVLFPIEPESESVTATGRAKTEETDRASRARLLESFRDAKYSWMQARVVEELIALGDKSIVQNMLEMLKSEDRQRRCNAGWVLAGLADDRGLTAVLEELNDVGPRPTKRIRSDGMPYVRGRVASDRYYAAHVLGRIGDRRAVPALIKVLKDESIGYQAAIVLAELGDPRAIPALKELLEMTRNTRQRSEWMYAGYALAKLRDPAGLPVLVDFLTRGLPTERRRAATAIGDTRIRQAVGALVKSLADDSPDVRVAVVTALGEIGNESAIPALQKLSTDMATTTIGSPIRTVRDVATSVIRKIKSATPSVTQPAE